ncbi:SCO3242 family prenyltransferase [Agromyces cerinus]|uniref:4-hydroxybenzoate polyprenyltransferase n=1 Tax=Agromyces cerinus subsp. cerinus TaxID=232089 RepID=A0A1N6GIG0_9MICO|nr:UbiA family prenyltransferase [Agromyces cerinus]SIO07319.1 4-hydroxybenzoate polyprenyltransferase [Agromyces cerinus subsp. cerinus]
MTSPADILDLVRAPAALTVIGDTLAGGHAGGARFTGRQWLLPAASVLLYSGGMALNDYADRQLDAEERPERPIPSGRVSAGDALAVVSGCFAAGLALAAAGGGRRGLGVAVPLVGAIVLYNTVAKSTPLGPVSMAACRGLDVMMGAGGARRALPAAATVALHTAGVTLHSRGEVHGGTVGVAGATLAITAASAVAAAAGDRGAFAARSAANGVSTAGPVGAVGTAGTRSTAWRIGATLATIAATASYLAATLPTQLRTLDDPSAGNVRTATRAGIGAMIPLQTTLVARTGALGSAALLTGVDLARRAISARRKRGDVT